MLLNSTIKIQKMWIKLVLIAIKLHYVWKGRKKWLKNDQEYTKSKESEKREGFIAKLLDYSNIDSAFFYFLIRLVAIFLQVVQSSIHSTQDVNAFECVDGSIDKSNSWSIHTYIYIYIYKHARVWIGVETQTYIVHL